MPATQRKLLSVMFTDIVGYSALVNADERRALKLLELHRQLLRRQVWLYGGRVVDTVGDGFLITFENALAAVECAVAIQQGFSRRNAEVKAEDRLRLRIGIHLGDVERSNRRLFGDGVNVAARVEPLSPHGGICVTAAVVSQIHGPMRTCFISQGPRNLKNIAEAHEIFCLDETQLDAAAALLTPARPWRQALRRGTSAIAMSLAALALVGAWAMYLYLQPIRDDASIAVLPLENLSTEPGSADFVSGLHDSLLSEISKTPQLRVISRTSVLRYIKDRASLPEIARQLQVAHVLEGSVQRQGRRIRVNVQLIRARTDDHVWAQSYDRDVDDLFEVQTEISREVARKIQGRLMVTALPKSQRPTTSIAAYDLYLRAIAQEDSDPTIGRQAPEGPIRLLEQAVALDPGFTLAHAAHARYNIWAAAWASYMDPQSKPRYVQAAMRSAQQAMELDPTLPESLLAMGQADYWTSKNPERAASFFKQALAIRPGYTFALYLLSGVYQDVGDLDRSIATVRMLLDYDPHNEKAYELLTDQLVRLRNYPAAAELYRQWLFHTQHPTYVEYRRAEFEFDRSGDLTPWKTFVKQPAVNGISGDELAFARWQVAMYEKRFRDAATINRQQADDFARDRTSEFAWALYVSLALAAADATGEAKPYLQTLVRYFNKLLVQNPTDRYSLAVLGLVQTILGDEQNALANTREALRLSAPVTGRRPIRQHYNDVLIYAQCAARFGLKQEALKQLEWLLQEPSSVHAHVVLLDPLWAPLNQDADFQALVRKYLPPNPGPV